MDKAILFCERYRQEKEVQVIDREKKFKRTKAQ